MEIPPAPEEGMKPALARLACGETLSEAQAETAVALILAGGATPAQIGGLLMALRARGETVAELTGAARAMRAAMLRVDLAEDTIDVCGTGGDQRGTLNVSTAVAFVAAGAGVKIAKHGNRAASSRSGGADVLACLGVRLDPPLARLPDILAYAGCVFLFAPRHHPGLAHAASVRAELGARTMFNLLGPLANPAGVRRQLTGVFDPRWARPVAEVLARLGSARSWAVHGGGLDELCLDSANLVVAQRGDDLLEMTLSAADLGLDPAPVTAIAGGDAAENAACLVELLEIRPPPGEAGRRRHRAYRDTVLMNAAAAIVVAGKTDYLADALARARESLDSGAALACLARLRAASERDA